MTSSSDANSRRLRRRGSVLVVAVALGLVVLGIWVLVARRGSVSVVKAELRSPDSLTLIVSSCEGDPEVSLLRETDQEVQVEVVSSSGSRLDCFDQVDVQLRDALGGRVVVDRYSGRSVRVVRVDSVGEFGDGITITGIPGGFAFTVAVGVGGSSSFMFATADGSAEFSVGRRLSAPPMSFQGRHVTRDGRVFTVVQAEGETRIVEDVGNGALIEVASRTLDTEALLDIAETVTYDPARDQ